MKKALLLILSLALFLSACTGAALPTAETAAEPAPATTAVPTEPKKEPSEAELAVSAMETSAEKARNAFADYEKQVFRVGKDREYKSFISLLLDLKGNESPKTIYLDEGEYDLFAEYSAEVKKGRIVVPLDTITSPDYFEPYNAFVPNRTRIVGEGQVTLRFTPAANQISYGASRTWSPLNIYGTVMVENVTVRGKNCRYCLHNDDHGRYSGALQYYKNVRLIYELSDPDSQGRILGFNNTVGFGINDKSTHLFEDCEIFFDGEGNHSAYYGHGPGKSSTGTIVLKNCHVHASDETNNRVIRLQTLSHDVTGRIMTLVDGCQVNGGLLLHLYYDDSIQSFDVIFRGTDHMKTSVSMNGEGVPRNPYKVRYLD